LFGKGVNIMAQCYVTGKKTLSGNRRSHAMNATRHTWKANLQTVRIRLEDGSVKKVKISARALKKLKLERV
jgi:large subunit ribosomal protein L28